MAWYEYDHASDEQTKALRRAHRDALIRVALLPHDLRITDFLRTYRDDYRKMAHRFETRCAISASSILAGT